MKALIIANGSLPSLKIIRKLLRKSDCIVCADGGANLARKLNIKPDIIIGDFDSITNSTKRFFNDIPQHQIDDQYSTDLEKAIQYCIGQKIEEANIIGAFGDRFDHTIGSIGSFKKFQGKILLCFIDNVATLSQINTSITVSTTPGEKISLIPLDHCAGVSTKNLKYKLNNDVLELGVQEGTSNIAMASSVTVSIKSGTLLLYRFHKT